MKNKIPKEIIETFFKKNIEDQFTAKKLLDFYLHYGNVKNANKHRIPIAEDDLLEFEKKLKKQEKKWQDKVDYTLEQHRIYMMDRAGATGIDKEILRQSDLTKNYNLF
jgi:hypothetical protein